jgi:hypothetical protein
VTEVVVPIGAMQPIPLVKVHYIRNIGQVIAGSSHISIAIFHIDIKSAGDSGV